MNGFWMVIVFWLVGVSVFLGLLGFMFWNREDMHHSLVLEALVFFLLVFPPAGAVGYTLHGDAIGLIYAAIASAAVVLMFLSYFVRLLAFLVRHRSIKAFLVFQYFAVLPAFLLFLGY